MHHKNTFNKILMFAKYNLHTFSATRTTYVYYSLCYVTVLLNFFVHIIMSHWINISNMLIKMSSLLSLCSSAHMRASM